MVGGNLEASDPELDRFLRSSHKLIKKDGSATLFKLIPQ